MALPIPPALIHWGLRALTHKLLKETSQEKYKRVASGVIQPPLQRSPAKASTILSVLGVLATFGSYQGWLPPEIFAMVKELLTIAATTTELPPEVMP